MEKVFEESHKGCKGYSIGDKKGLTYEQATDIKFFSGEYMEIYLEKLKNRGDGFYNNDEMGRIIYEKEKDPIFPLPGRCNRCSERFKPKDYVLVGFYTPLWPDRFYSPIIPSPPIEEALAKYESEWNWLIHENEIGPRAFAANVSHFLIQPSGKKKLKAGLKR